MSDAVGSLTCGDQRGERRAQGDVHTNEAAEVSAPLYYVCQEWFKSDKTAQRRLAASIELLISIRALAPAARGMVQVGHEAHRSLQAKICDPMLHPSGAIVLAGSAEGLQATVASGVEIWEERLLFMVGVDGAEEPSEVFRTILLRKGFLVDRSSETTETEYILSSAGFQFLLSNVSHQVWTCLLSYIDVVGQPADDVFGLLFKLAELPEGMALGIDTIREAQEDLVDVLLEFGLCTSSQDKQGLVPTQLVRQLCAGSTASKEGLGYIVVESNFKVFLKSSSNLKKAIVSLFARIDASLPGLVVCSISQRSVRRAFVHGITAKQIQQFLRDHAHPAMMVIDPASDDRGLPSNVLEQISIWEESRQRIRFSKAVLYDRFENHEIFDAAVKYSRDLQSHLWSNELSFSTNPAEEGQESNGEEILRRQRDEPTLLVALDAHPSVKGFVVDLKRDHDAELYL